MSVRARLFVAVVLTLGMVAAGLAVAGWTSSGLLTFAIFFVACIATSLLRLTLPGIEGSLSVAYVFLLWGITRMGLGETMLVGTVSTVVQSYWRCKQKPRVVQVAFNAALIVLSVGVGRLVFTSRLLQSVVPKEPLRILLVSVAYFLVNTSCVATVIARCTRVWSCRPVGSPSRSGMIRGERGVSNPRPPGPQPGALTN